MNLPISVINYYDNRGRNILDYEFNPFTDMIECINVDEIIKNRSTNIIIGSGVSNRDIIRIITAGWIRVLKYEPQTRLNLPELHVDFVSGNIEISSYYSEIESEKTVVLIPGDTKVTNNLIRLGGGNILSKYAGAVESKYIRSSNYTNIPAVEHIVTNDWQLMKKYIEKTSNDYQIAIDDLEVIKHTSATISRLKVSK